MLSQRAVPGVLCLAWCAAGPGWLQVRGQSARLLLLPMLQWKTSESGSAETVSMRLLSQLVACLTALPCHVPMQRQNLLALELGTVQC